MEAKVEILLITTGYLGRMEDQTGIVN